ncbi:hypothetical protein LCGC14_1237560 [marine sediment metagenome]|uniref:Uncharacterized protein n=1 Tax=marine sediment metagenome TaxID=412755 RepID=A0A0F9LAX5_9ZZZZ
MMPEFKVNEYITLKLEKGNVQLEELNHHLIGHEFRYRNISLITVCKDPSTIYDDLRYFSQIKLNMD